MSRRKPWLLVLASRSVARAIGARLYGQVPRPGVEACSQWPLGIRSWPREESPLGRHESGLFRRSWSRAVDYRLGLLLELSREIA